MQHALIEIPIHIHRHVRGKERCLQSGLRQTDPVQVVSGQQDKFPAKPLVLARDNDGCPRQRQSRGVVRQPGARHRIAPVRRDKGKENPFLTVPHAPAPRHLRPALPDLGRDRIRRPDFDRPPRPFDAHPAPLRQRLPRPLPLPQDLRLHVLAVLPEGQPVRKQGIPPDALNQRATPAAERRIRDLPHGHGAPPDHIPVSERPLHGHRRFHHPFRPGQHLVQEPLQDRLPIQSQIQEDKRMVGIAPRAVPAFDQDIIPRRTRCAPEAPELKAFL